MKLYSFSSPLLAINKNEWVTLGTSLILTSSGIIVDINGAKREWRTPQTYFFQLERNLFSPKIVACKH